MFARQKRLLKAEQLHAQRFVLDRTQLALRKPWTAEMGDPLVLYELQFDALNRTPVGPKTWQEGRERRAGSLGQEGTGKMLLSLTTQVGDSARLSPLWHANGGVWEVADGHTTPALYIALLCCLDHIS